MSSLPPCNCLPEVVNGLETIAGRARHLDTVCENVVDVRIVR